MRTGCGLRRGDGDERLCVGASEADGPRGGTEAPAGTASSCPAEHAHPHARAPLWLIGTASLAHHVLRRVLPLLISATCRQNPRNSQACRLALLTTDNFTALAQGRKPRPLFPWPQGKPEPTRPSPSLAAFPGGQGLPARWGFTDCGEVNARPYKHHQTLKTTVKTSSCVAHTH